MGDKMKIATIPFERDHSGPLYLQIYKKLKQDMRAGYLKKNDKLPSIREAMTLFNVSKTSVENAYDKLVLEGYIVSIAHKGYFVDVNQTDLVKREEIFEKEANVDAFVEYNLTSDAIDHHSFDMMLWKRYMKEAMEDKQSLATYGDVQGELPLRKAIQKYAYTQRGVVCEVDQIIVGASYQSLLYLLCSLLEKQCCVAMEEDSFLQANQVFKDMHYQVTYLPREEESISLEHLRQSDANVLYVQSSACGKYRRQLATHKEALLSWCDTSHYIIEDDHNGELRYEEKVLPALQGYASNQQVIYLGSFSKILLPSLRIAYMVLPPQLLEKFKKKQTNYSPTASKMEQVALAKYIAQGNLDRHIKKVRKQYERKNKKMKELLQKYFTEQFYYLEETSFQYVIEFKEGLLDNIDSYFKQKNIALKKKGSILYISFSSLQERDMEEVIQQIAHYIQKGERR